jgi:hypothetical protein
MTPEEYERERQRLEDQLRSDIELLQTAHQARLKALEAVWRSSHPPAEEAPQSHSRRARGGDGELDAAVEDALERLPREFTSRDLRRELGFSPNRSSLHRALRRLEENGALAVLQFGTGRRPALYRKTKRSNGSPG